MQAIGWVTAEWEKQKHERLLDQPPVCQIPRGKISLPPVEPVGNSTRLPIHESGDSWCNSEANLNTLRCLTILWPKPIRSRGSFSCRSMIIFSWRNVQFSWNCRFRIIHTVAATVCQLAAASCHGRNETLAVAPASVSSEDANCSGYTWFG